MSASTHTCAHKRHTHGDTQMLTPCGHAFFCLPVSNQKKRFKDEVKEECWRQREEDLSALMDEVNTCCVWETVITVREGNGLSRLHGVVVIIQHIHAVCMFIYIAVLISSVIVICGVNTLWADNYAWCRCVLGSITVEQLLSRCLP